MRRSRNHRAFILGFIAVSFLAPPMAVGQNPTREGVEAIASGKFSPYAGRNFPTRVFFGDTHATTGPRMTVRFFGGWDFTERDTLSRLPADAGYTRGVPMGGDLSSAPEGQAPSFLVAARRDPYSGNLDRIQIVKGWMDRKGKTHEKVYDVVWSGDRQQGTDGKVPPVGNTVDVKNATWTNTIGASELIAVWIDPDFDADESAFYYARVIEIPTPSPRMVSGPITPDLSGIPTLKTDGGKLSARCSRARVAPVLTLYSRFTTRGDCKNAHLVVGKEY